MNKKKYIIISIVSFLISISCLVIGALFHGYRTQTQDINLYNIGVTMGIVMVSLFIIFCILGIVMAVIYKRKERNGRKN